MKLLRIKKEKVSSKSTAFEIPNNIDKKLSFQKLEYQRGYMDKLYEKFQFKSFEDWYTVTVNKYYENDGRYLLLNYSENIKILLSRIYPNYPWKFEELNFTSNEIKNIVIQHKIMNYFIIKYQIKNLKEFEENEQILINFKKEINCKKLLSFYSNDFFKLLTNFFPNFPWNYTNYLFTYSRKQLLTTTKYQRAFIEIIAKKKKISTNILDNNNNHIKKLKKVDIIQYGGQKLLDLYSNNLTELFKALYPDKEFSRYPQNYFKLLSNQQNFMEDLFYKLNFNSLNDWIETPKQKIVDHGGYPLLYYIFNNEKNQLLLSIYPNFPWDFNPFDKQKFSKKYFLENIENQRKFMDYLFIELNLKSIEEFSKIKIFQIRNFGGEKLLKIYKKDLNLLLSTIYPTYDWNFVTNINNSNIYFSKKDNQRKFMDNLYKKLKFQSMDDFFSIKRKQFIRYGGLLLLRSYGDYKKLLQSIYPRYDWNFNNYHRVRLTKTYFESIENQKEFLIELYKKLNLKSIEELINVPKSSIIQFGGVKLLRKYQYDIKNLLLSLFPDYLWPFHLNQIGKEYFKSINNQLVFMDNLYEKFKLKSISGWLKIKARKIIKYGGKDLLILYSKKMKKLLTNLYPNYPWQAEFLNNSLLLFENQKIEIKLIEKKLNIKSLNDWYNIRKFQLIHGGAKRILEFYNNDIQLLLQTIYPNHPWEFQSLKFRPFLSYFHSRYFLKQQISFLMKKYSIKEKKDWYRISIRTKEINNLFKALEITFPNEKWEKRKLFLRVKKSKQRQLYLCILKLFPSYYLLENYRHPYMKSSIYQTEAIPLEFDIYIAALNIAFEYQGQQHYDDLPSAFNQLETYQSNDEIKRILCRNHNIKLIAVPYWWNASSSTLFSSFKNHFV